MSCEDVKILCGIEWASEVKRNYSKINVISRNFLLVEFSIFSQKSACGIKSLKYYRHYLKKIKESAS